MNSDHILARGIKLHRAGQLGQAIESYRQVLAQNPRQADALNLLGLACHQAGQSQAGAQCIAQAIQINGKVTGYYLNLGIVLRALGQAELALDSYRRALALDAKLPDAWYNLANLQRDLGRLEEAASSYNQALRLQPRSPDVLNNLGVVCQTLKRWEEAERCFRRALELAPHFADAHSNLGSLLETLCRFDEALKHGQEAVRLQPQNAGSWINLGLIWHGLKQVEKGVAAYRRGLELEPRNATGHLNLAMLLLQAGDFSAGWPEYEWRLQCPNNALPKSTTSKPRWDGSPLAGRTILVHAEQGLGDALQFARFVPLLVAQGARVLLECHEPLVRLLRNLSGVSQVFPQGSPLPEFDCHAPLMSLPFILGTTLASLPRSLPYLHSASPSFSLAPTQRTRVGLCWSSNVKAKNNLHRLIRLESLRPLLELEQCEFFSFQMGDPARELESLPPHLRPKDLIGQIRDFSDTADLVAQMDLIITVDTSMAHLAGAMNKPVWTLLSCNSDWRWLFDRTDSPWYPSMRLFRQNRPGDWNEIVQAVRTQLQNFQRLA